MARGIAGDEVKHVSNHMPGDVHRVDMGEAAREPEASPSTPDRMVRITVGQLAGSFSHLQPAKLIDAVGIPYYPLPSITRRLVNVISTAATPAGTTAGTCPWCCSSSRPPTTRTPSWTPPATSITPPSPDPTWRPSPNGGSWLTRGCRPRRNPGKGCHCSDWSRCNFAGDAAPGVSYREATNTHE